jgi:hypothetical protein
MEQIDMTSVQVSETLDDSDPQIIFAEENYHPIDNHLLAKNLPEPLQVVQTTKEEEEVYELWADTYKSVYPDFKFCSHDPQNIQAHILYTRDKNNNVISSIRLTIDSPLGLPSNGYYPPELDRHREQGNKLMEFGRLVSIGGGLQLLKTYYRSVYQIAKAENIDIIVMTLKQKDVAFHRHLMGAYSVLDDMEIPHGGKDKMSCVIWEIKHTKPRFFKWIELIQGETK